MRERRPKVNLKTCKTVLCFCVERSCEKLESTLELPELVVTEPKQALQADCARHRFLLKRRSQYAFCSCSSLKYFRENKNAQGWAWVNPTKASQETRRLLGVGHTGGLGV